MKSVTSKLTKQSNNNDLTAMNQNTSNNVAYRSNRGIATTIVHGNGTIGNSNITTTGTIQNANAILTNGTLVNAMDFDNKVLFSTASTTAIAASHAAATKLSNIQRATIVNAVPMNCFEDSIDGAMVKEEPMSPHTSCPPSPNTSCASGIITDATGHTIIVTQPQQTIGATQFNTINMNLANVATYTNTDLVFEHNKVRIFMDYVFVVGFDLFTSWINGTNFYSLFELIVSLSLVFCICFQPGIQNGSLKLSPASQSLLKSQQIILNGTQQRIVMPKLDIRMDAQPQQAQGMALNKITTNVHKRNER